MKTFSRFAALALLFAFLCVPREASAQDWQLVWSDEFDGTEVDASKWAFQLGDGCPDLCGWGNGEEQYYTAENATVDGGTLKITARQEQVGGREYTSARMRTLGQASWTYGRIETRAKMPRNDGFWPAIWMLPSDETYGQWAASGEIDILEVFGNAPATVHGTVHFGGVSPGNTYQGGSWSLPIRDFSRAFHDFAIEWVPGEIRWYVDGNLYHTQNEWYTTEARFPAPFDQDFHLLANVAIGGGAGSPNSGTVFPQSLEIDYIRVYQSENEAPTVSLTNPGNGAAVSAGAPLTIQASASDSDGQVSRVLFYAGDGLLGVDSEAPFEMAIGTLAQGCYSLRAKAVDNLGGETWSAASDITAGSCGQAPYQLAAAHLPGVVQAENFDLGGEGVAYHDMDAANAGNAGGNDYRVGEGVDIEYVLGRDQGYVIRDFEAGEWVGYQVDVAGTGAFNLDLRATSTAGATVTVLSGDTELISILQIPPTGPGEYATARATSIPMEAGVQTLRIEVATGSLGMDHITVSPYVEPPPAGTSLIDDFSASTSADWGFFGTARADVTFDGGINPFIRATYAGGGGTGAGFYGVMWKNLDESSQAVLPADPWFHVRVRHPSSLTTVESYRFEITLREDTNGDGWTSGFEDSHRFDTRFDASAFNDEWITINAPLTAFTNLGTGGNGILETAIDEVVFVVSGVAGPDPSAVVVDLDDVLISTGPSGTGTEADLPDDFGLRAPYPNPASDRLYVEYDLPAAGPASLRVFDILGRRVMQAEAGFRGAGRHFQALEVASLSAGVYFIQLEADGTTQNRRVVIAR